MVQVSPVWRARTKAAYPQIALGVSLARRGIVPVISMLVCAVTVLSCALLAFVLVARSREAHVQNVPVVASSALVYGGGFLHAFSASVHALLRDRSDGVRDLLVMRTTSTRGYLVARVGGLAALLALTLGGGSLLAGVASVVAARHVGAVGETVQATVAACVFSVAFAVVVTPVALAAVGARSRVGGYLFLLTIVVAPTLLAHAVSGATSYAELLSIPTALDALRASLLPGSLAPLRFVRALLALAAYTAGALLIVARDVRALEPGAERT